jgi:hypothetical protein
MALLPTNGIRMQLLCFQQATRMHPCGVFTFPEKSIATVTVFPHFPALVWFGA